MEIREGEASGASSTTETSDSTVSSLCVFPLGHSSRRQPLARAAEPSADDESGIEPLALADGWLLRCRLGESESPQDMFYRCWGTRPFVRTEDDRLSTFSVDVDTASYTLARRYLRDGWMPTREQVRTEEFVNYFRADQEPPVGDAVFAIGIESAPSLFHAEPAVEMMRVTVRGRDVDRTERQPLALTIVIDTSGSMSDGRLELVKDALQLLIEQLAVSDSIALVAFSNEARTVAPMTSAANRGWLEDAIAGLNASGGTNLEGGLTRGYELAADALTPNAVNRVVLLSDGVGNIGETDKERLGEAVERHRELGIYLNTIGVGMGNVNDDVLEQLADRGDGIAQYIDSKDEAEKALVDDFTKTLQPIARDVKIQVEFDPAAVSAYRLLGYENRVIADQDFRNDAVDAGEVNAGHQVTALYEIAPVPGARLDGAVATVRVRYKRPFAIDGGERSEADRERAEVATEIERVMTRADLVPTFDGASFGYRRSVLAAQFAEFLRESGHARGDSLDVLLREARELADEREDPETRELLSLIELAEETLRMRIEEASSELGSALEALRHLQYSQAVIEQAQTEDERALEKARRIAEKIAKLEARVRQLVAERYGEKVLGPEELRRLGDLGYIDGDEGGKR